EYFKKDWGKIIITDATSKSFSLYAVNGEVNLNNYEMPPLPPSGMFDIRYSSGRIAEDLSSTQSIEMTAVEYPITVRVENMSIRLMDETGKDLTKELLAGEEITISNKSIHKLMVLSGELITPEEYSLEQNYPNPFNPATTIKFSLAEASDVSLTIYNTIGQKVTELVSGKLEAGKYSYQWNAQNIATGMYIYELRADNFISVKKMILLK
ncbi:MAG: T9SS type A sorting domain-containing protein, partial [Ignavibacteriales bacterium]